LNVRLVLKRLAGDLHSSLIGLVVSEEVKRVYKIDPKGPMLYKHFSSSLTNVHLSFYLESLSRPAYYFPRAWSSTCHFALPSYNRRGWKRLQGRNGLAYFGHFVGDEIKVFYKVGTGRKQQDVPDDDDDGVRR
jgi:hypothetical protein